MALVSDLSGAASDAVSSQVDGGKADEITVNPSSLHGHQGNGDVFILKDDSLKFELFRSSDDLTYIYGNNDLAAYCGGGAETIYYFGVETHLQFSESAASIKVHDLDSKATIDLFNAAPGTTLQPDGHGFVQDEAATLCVCHHRPDRWAGRLYGDSQVGKDVFHRSFGRLHQPRTTL